MIRLAAPVIGEEEIRAVAEVLRSGQLVQAERVAAFERGLQGRLDGCDVVAVSSGTAALHVALLALDVRPGDLVVVPTYSWPATANVVAQSGADPVFVDIQEDTFNMDPRALAETLDRLMACEETARRVRAVIIVHGFGAMADMGPILSAVERYGLPVIEDAACALGASLDGRPAGTWGALGCFSLHPRKVVTTGEGGAVACRSASLRRRLRALRNHGLDPEGASPDFILPGLNYRMTEFQAAVGSCQLARLDELLAVRLRQARRYDQLLAPTGIRAPATCPGSVPTYQSYVTLLPVAGREVRDSVIPALRAQGIEVQIGTWHIPLTSYYRSRYGFRRGDFPVTDGVFDHALALPMAASMTEAEQERVVERLQATLGGT